MATKKITTTTEQTSTDIASDTLRLPQQTIQKQLLEIIHSQNPAEEIQKLTSRINTAEEKKYVAEIISRILAINSIHIYTGKYDNAHNVLQNALISIDCTLLEHASFVLAEENDFGGIERAFDIYNQNPDQKLILVSIFDLEALKNVNKNSIKLEFLLKQKNVRFLNLFDSTSFENFKQETGFTINGFDNNITPRPIKTFDPKLLETIFDKVPDLDVSDGSITETSFQNIVESEISHFLHDARYWKEVGIGDHSMYEEQLPYLFTLPEEKKNEQWIAFENKLIALLQIQHPSFKLLPRKQNLQRIVDMFKYSRTKELPEGTRFEGVFVDRDGTLYDNKNLKFNKKIIGMIKEYEQQGKKITIWTGGNLEMKQKLLDEAGLDYKIQNKTDYKGGTIEIAIDNDSQEFLLANAKIKSENHIKV